MIQPNQLFEKINENKLLIVFENTETIIAEINKERFITFSKEFEESLTDKAKQKINHIAKYYDNGFFVPVSENSGVNVDIPMEAKFQRFMNERPQINRNDLCKVHGRIDTDYTAIFRIEDIGEFSNTVKLKNIENSNILEDVYIFDIVLVKEYHENLYYIQNGYVGNAMCWWALDSKGYTTDIKKAHKFTKDEALSILKNNANDKRKNEIIWNVDYIDTQTAAHQLVIVSDYLDNSWKENQLKLNE